MVRFEYRKNKAFVFSYFLILVVLGSIQVQAQTLTTISFAPPIWLSGNIQDQLFDEFESNHNVEVVIVPMDAGDYYPNASGDIMTHLDGAKAYAERADVLYVTNNTLSTEMTRAGFILDLQPLIAVDTNFPVEAFRNNIWEAFRWDNAHWAIPVSASISVLTYEKSRFDNFGIPYSDHAWTVDELVQIADRVRSSDDGGNHPILFTSSPEQYLLGLYGQPLYDNFSGMPDLDQSGLREIISQWGEIAQEGIVVNMLTSMADFEQILITQTTISDLSRLNRNGYGFTLFPDGTSSMDAHGFAVSGGTDHPELAYELVKYLSQNETFITLLNTDVPARMDIEILDLSSSRTLDFWQVAVDSALPVSALPHRGYLRSILTEITNGTDIDTAIFNAQTTLDQNLTSAIEFQDGALNVRTYRRRNELDPNQIAIKFGLFQMSSPLPGGSNWDNAIERFINNHPNVGQIDLVVDYARHDNFARDVDCFYTPTNILPDADLSTLLDIKPLLDADGNFSSNSELVGRSLSMLTVENAVYGYPITIYPQVMFYNQTALNNLGVPAPAIDWTLSDFLFMLDTIASLDISENAFNPYGLDTIQWLMLIASAGGLPFDYRTTPPTVNLTDPDVVDAIRQVLDLAKQDHVQYNKLHSWVTVLGSIEANIIIGNVLSESALVGMNRLDSVYMPVFFPTGSDYVPITFDIGSAYISRSSAHIDACYDWISWIVADAPELFSGIPVNGLHHAYLSETTEQLYNIFIDYLTSPNAVILPRPAGTHLTEYAWLNRVFDNYVLNDADLETELKLAEDFINEFRACIANSSPRTAGNCVIDIDPTLFDF